MNYAVGCLLLLLLVLSAGLLLRIEGFAAGDAGTTPTTPPTTTVATLNELKNVSARIAAAITVLNTSKISTDISRSNTLALIKSAVDKIIALVTLGALSIEKSPVTSAAATAFLADLDDKTKVLPTLLPISPSAAPAAEATTAAAAGPSPTNDALVASLLASLVATKAATTTTVPSAASGTQSTPAATTTTCTAQVAANVKPYSEALDIMKAQNKSLQNAAIQRCPNMRDYVRKDSIPCYNCSV